MSLLHSPFLLDFLCHPSDERREKKTEDEDAGSMWPIQKPCPPSCSPTYLHSLVANRSHVPWPALEDRNMELRRHKPSARGLVPLGSPPRARPTLSHTQSPTFKTKFCNTSWQDPLMGWASWPQRPCCPLLQPSPLTSSSFAWSGGMGCLQGWRGAAGTSSIPSPSQCAWGHVIWDEGEGQKILGKGKNMCMP